MPTFASFASGRCSSKPGNAINNAAATSTKVSGPASIVKRIRNKTMNGRSTIAAIVVEVSNSRSTEAHIEAIRLTSLTAGPTTVKSSRSSLPMLP